MKTDRSDELPARRLGILYVASFFTIALLSGISQAFILRELSWQSRAISSIAQSARQRSLDHSWSTLATALLAASEPRERRELETALRNATHPVGMNRRIRLARAQPFPRRASRIRSRPGCGGTPRRTARRRLEAAHSLISLVERNRADKTAIGGIRAARKNHHRTRRCVQPGSRRARAGLRGRRGRPHPEYRVVRVQIVRARPGRARPRRPLRGQPGGPEDPPDHAGDGAGRTTS